MENGLIIPYRRRERDESLREAQPLSGLGWQAGKAREAGRKPEVSGPRDEKRSFFR